MIWAPSLKRTKMRLRAGSNGTAPAPVTKMAKVGVALAPMLVVTVLVGDAMQTPVAGVV